MDKQKDSLYLPYRMIIEKITDEAPGVRTFRLKFKEEREGEDFHFKAGQFGEYSAFGEGRVCLFLYSVLFSYAQRIYQCTFRQAGRVTTGLSRLETGRHDRFSPAPFGNTFPFWMNGKDRIFCL